MDLENILKHIEKKVKYAELRSQKYRTSDLVMKNGIVSSVGYVEERGVAIRVLDKGIGFASTNSLEPDKLMLAADRALKMARASANSSIGFSTENPVEDKWSVEEKIKIEDIQTETKLEYLKEVESVLNSLQVPMKIQVLKDKIVETEYLNSEGSRIQSYLPSVGYFYLVGIMENGNFEQASLHLGRAGGYEAWQDWNISEKTKNEIDKLKKIAVAKRLNEGRMDLIVGPEISGIVAHESAGHPTEADRIMGREAAQAGESFVKSDMIGHRIGSEVVNVVDDPTMEHSFGYYKYDAEGVKARKRYLYKEGKIHEFLQNRETAYRLKSESNAASRSSWWDREPIVRMSTTYIEPGDHSVEELFEDVRSGVFMNSFTEWNIDDVRFNEKYIGREAYLIENGEIKEPVKRPVLEITTTGFYSAVDAVSKELEMFAGTCGKSDPMQGVDVWMGGPHVRLRNVYLR